MWMEGETTPDRFPATLFKILKEAKDDEGLPMWEPVSSNVGSTLIDDGYVFYSKGSSGQDNIYIGFKNAYYDAANWYKGHRFFVTDSYTPSETPGVNGHLGEHIYEGFRYHWDNTYVPSGQPPINTSTFGMRYGISINKDRVVIVLRTNFVGHGANFGWGWQPTHLRNMLYMGLIKRYSEEIDSSAIALTTLYPIFSNTANNVRLLRNGSRIVGGAYNVLNANHHPKEGRTGWGRQFIANTIPLATATEGVRGELDGVLQLMHNYEPAMYGRNVPEEGTVLINGTEYMTIMRPYLHWGHYDSLAPVNGPSYAYFITKA